MNYETVKYEIIANTTALLTLNRPDALNTFSTQLAVDLYDALVTADTDEKVRVIVIRGAGKAFCAGIDVKELEGKSANEYQHWIEKMERPLNGIAKLTKPVIASHHGVAVANGMGLVAAADLVISADTARMGLTAINVGLNCVGPVIPVARCVGRKRALELLLSGRVIGALEAKEIGLVNRVVKEEELEKETLKWAAEFAAKSPIALQIAKTGFYNSEDMEYDKQFTYMNEAFARLCTTDDAKEGVAAFFDKRKPIWKGH